MVGQVTTCFQPVLLVLLVPLLDALFTGGTEAEGLESIGMDSRSKLSSGQRAHHYSPGMEKLMDKLGFSTMVTENPRQSRGADDDEDERQPQPEVRERHMRSQRLDAEQVEDEGRRLKEEYYRQRGEKETQRRDLDVPHGSADARESRRGYSRREPRSRSKDRYEEGAVDEEPQPQRDIDDRPSLMRRASFRRRSNDEDEEEAQEERPVGRDEEYGDSDERSSSVRDGDDSDDNQGDNRYPSVGGFREHPSLAEDYGEDRRQHARSETEEHPEGLEEDAASEMRRQRRIREMASHRIEDSEQDQAESPREQVKKQATLSETQAKEAADSAGMQGLAVGESVRAYIRETNKWQSGRIASAHKDGTVTVYWDSGSTENRVVNTTDVFKLPKHGNPSPYRFEGKNAYDLVQEKQNRIAQEKQQRLSGSALTPSKKTVAKKMYDGYTLFDPSALAEESQ